MLVKEVEYLVPDKDERTQIWKLILGQLHYRSVIFFARTDVPSRSEWNRFSSLMSFGLQVLSSVSITVPSPTPSESPRPVRRRSSSWLSGGAVTTTTLPTQVTTLDPSDAAKKLATVSKLLASINSAVDDIMATIGLVDATVSRPSEFSLSVNRLRSIIVSRFSGILAAATDSPVGISGKTRSEMMQIPARIASMNDSSEWPSLKTDIETSVRVLRSELIEAALLVTNV